VCRTLTARGPKQNNLTALDLVAAATRLPFIFNNSRIVELGSRESEEIFWVHSLESKQKLHSSLHAFKKIWLPLFLFQVCPILGPFGQ
jgi:hypothetical protein